MTVETKLDFNKYLKLRMILLFRRPASIIFTISGLLMFIYAILHLSGLALPSVNLSDSALIILGFVLVFLRPLAVYYSTKKLYSSNAGGLQETKVYEFTQEYFKITANTLNAELKWERVHKITELKDWILIYQNSFVASPIPKEAFGNKLYEFKQLVRLKPFIKLNLREE
jgi:hypothetical protein